MINFNSFIAANDYNFGVQITEVTAVMLPCRQINCQHKGKFLARVAISSKGVVSYSCLVFTKSMNSNFRGF